MLNESIYRSPNWLKKFADFEIHTGEDIKGDTSKSRIIKRSNKRFKDVNPSDFAKFYTKIIDLNLTRLDVERKFDYIKNKHKLDESFWKKFDIWADFKEVYPYTNLIINDDLTVDIIGSTTPIVRNGKLPPMKIKSSGNFLIRDEIKSLEYSPEIIEGSFFVENNSLVNLIGSPRIVTGHFSLSDGNLKSLEGGPDEVYTYSVKNNKITSFKGCPRSGHYFNFENNLIWNLEYMPSVNLITLRGNPVQIIWKM